MHLPLANSQSHTEQGETRPALTLSSGSSLGWPLPAGPQRRLRFAYCWKAPLDSETTASLRFTLLANGTKQSPIYSKSVHLGDPRHSGRVWHTADLSIPGTRYPATLRLDFLENRASSIRPTLILAEPTLSPETARAPRVLILFDIDTLRRDHVSTYGYRLPTTPHIDRFFSDGLIAENCVSNAEWTLPSHATLFTSTLPNRHGTGDVNQSLPDSLPTLAESLAEAGYRTLAVTNGGYVDPVFGFARGFDVYRVVDSNVETVEAEMRTALSLIDLYSGEPIFLFFHTYQVHDYAPTRKAAMELFGSLQELGPHWADRNPLGNRPVPDPRRSWSNRYDAALRAVDDAFAQLLSGLQDRGLLPSTGLVLTSDHGEEIFDRPESSSGFQGLGHTHPFLYEEYLAVPLLMKFPWLEVAPRRIAENLSLVDVAPTLLDAVRAPRPATFEGASLFSLAEDSRSPERFIVSESSRYDSLAVRLGSHKMILRPGYPIRSWEDGTPFGTLSTEECFDLQADAAERNPSPCKDQAWAANLRVRAQEYIQDEFPGSLLIRFPASATPGESQDYAVRARGRDRPPSVLSFGMDPVNKLVSRGDTVTGQFRVGSAPVWVAVRPPRPGGAIEVQTFGLPSFHVPGRREPVESGTFRWAELLMRTGTAAPSKEGVVAFSTAPTPWIWSPRPESLPLSVIARLRSLGYISAGEWLRQEAAAEEPAPEALPPMDIPDGSVRIQTRTRLPAPAQAAARAGGQLEVATARANLPRAGQHR